MSEGKGNEGGGVHPAILKAGKRNPTGESPSPDHQPCCSCIPSLHCPATFIVGAATNLPQAGSVCMKRSPDPRSSSRARPGGSSMARRCSWTEARPSLEVSTMASVSPTSSTPTRVCRARHGTARAPCFRSRSPRRFVEEWTADQL
jgi:hypothetical protein